MTKLVITNYQVCRDEHKKKHPDDQIVFAEFSKKCAERWREMNEKEKKRFEDIAAKVSMLTLCSTYFCGN